MSDEPSACGCCRAPVVDRSADDPWEGRLDGYCYSCALARCDAFPCDHRTVRAVERSVYEAAKAAVDRVAEGVPAIVVTVAVNAAVYEYERTRVG